MKRRACVTAGLSFMLSTTSFTPKGNNDMYRTLQIAFLTALFSLASYAQVDKRIEAIRSLYTQTNEAIAIADKEAPYTDIFVVELAVNKAEVSYPAVGTYSNVARFYYTFGDREKDPYPNRLMKVNVVTRRSATITNAEFLYENGELVFGFVKADGEDASETRLYFDRGRLIRLLDGDKEVNIRNRNAIETSAAFRKESARLTGLFTSALKEGL